VIEKGIEGILGNLKARCVRINADRVSVITLTAARVLASDVTVTVGSLFLDSSCGDSLCEGDELIVGAIHRLNIESTDWKHLVRVNRFIVNTTGSGVTVDGYVRVDVLNVTKISGGFLSVQGGLNATGGLTGAGTLRVLGAGSTARSRALRPSFVYVNGSFAPWPNSALSLDVKTGAVVDVSGEMDAGGGVSATGKVFVRGNASISDFDVSGTLLVTDNVIGSDASVVVLHPGVVDVHGSANIGSLSLGTFYLVGGRFTVSDRGSLGDSVVLYNSGRVVVKSGDLRVTSGGCFRTLVQ
jgi:hypothetical protein